MTEDPDYIDPAELRRRAAERGGKGPVAGGNRPAIRRTSDIAITAPTGCTFKDNRITRP